MGGTGRSVTRRVGSVSSLGILRTAVEGGEKRRMVTPGTLQNQNRLTPPAQILVFQRPDPRLVAAPELRGIQLRRLSGPLRPEFMLGRTGERVLIKSALSRVIANGVNMRT